MVDHPVPSIRGDLLLPLLNKDETPFSVFWYDRYPEIMRPNSQQAASGSVPAPFGTPVIPPADGE